MIVKEVLCSTWDSDKDEDQQKHDALMKAMECLQLFISPNDTIRLEVDEHGQCIFAITFDNGIASENYRWSIACDSPRAVFTDTVAQVIRCLRENY